MPSKNPKISAYPPPELLEKIKEYQEARGLSMSEAMMELIVYALDIRDELKDRLSPIEQAILVVETINPLKDAIAEVMARVGRIEERLSSSSSPVPVSPPSPEIVNPEIVNPEIAKSEIAKPEIAKPERRSYLTASQTAQLLNLPVSRLKTLDRMPSLQIETFLKTEDPQHRDWTHHRDKGLYSYPNP